MTDAKIDGADNAPEATLNAITALGSVSRGSKPCDGNIKVESFHGHQVRGRFHKGEWWLSIIDIITALEVSTQPSRYWHELSADLADKEGFSELFGKIEKLKMPSADGKMRGTEAVTIGTLLRVDEPPSSGPGGMLV